MSPRPVLLVTLALAACRGRAPARAEPMRGPFAPPSELTATLAEGAHVDLQWKNNAAEAGGAFLEFNMNPGEEYTILEIVPPDTTRIRHPDVAPETRFSYRVRPFFGPASEVVEVTTGRAPAKPPREEEGPLGPPDTVKTPQASLRGAATMAAARPGAVTAALASPTTVDLRWQDRAGDEEGYLVEAAVDPAQPFRVVAVLPADSASFRKIRLPENTRCRFRVRPYFLGEPSPAATLQTPAQAGHS